MIATKFPSVRRVLALIAKSEPNAVIAAIANETGVVAVNEMGNPIALYSDPNFRSQITAGVKAGDYLYYASLTLDYIGRLPLAQEIYQ